MKGYIYVLSNDYMPGILKIGRSVNGGFHRSKSLYSTGVPGEFTLEFEMLVDDCVDIEKTVHQNLSKYRVNDNREFFKIDNTEAIQEIMSAKAAYFDSEICHLEEVDAVNRLRCIAQDLGLPWVFLSNALEFIERDEWKNAIIRYKAYLEKLKEAHKYVS